MKTTLSLWALLSAFSAMADSARLTMRGTPGYGQNPWVTLIRCRVSADGFMARESCENDAIQRPLNVELELDTGYYALTYANSLAFVNLRAGDRVEVELEEVSIDLDMPKRRIFWGTLGSYLVTRDLSHDIERQKLLQLFWGLPSQGYDSNEACGESTLLSKKICESWRSPSGASSFGWMLATSSQGYSWLDPAQRFPPLRQLDVTPLSVPYGKHVLVLPGAYTVHDRAMDLKEGYTVGLDRVIRSSRSPQRSESSGAQSPSLKAHEILTPVP